MPSAVDVVDQVVDRSLTAGARSLQLIVTDSGQTDIPGLLPLGRELRDHPRERRYPAAHRRRV